MPILTEGGIHFFNLINDYSAWHGLLILALVFSIAMHYCYSFATTKLRFISDLEEMIGKFIRFWGMFFAGNRNLFAKKKIFYIFLKRTIFENVLNKLFSS